MNIKIIKELEVGPVRIILKRYDCNYFGKKFAYRIFVNALKTNNPLTFHGPYYSEGVAKGQLTRISKDPRWS